MVFSEDLDSILSRIGADWEPLRGQNIFITGGTGFFGTWLLESFARANDALQLRAKAYVLTRSPSDFVVKCPHLGLRSDIVLHRGEIRDFKFPPGAFPFVIHAAADTSARSSFGPTLHAFQTLLDGTRHVLEFASAAKVERFLFISSGAVYGSQPLELPAIPESYLGAPDPFCENSFYGEAKRACEWLCAAHARNFGYQMNSARCFSFVGPHLPLDGPYAIGNFLRDASAGIAPRARSTGQVFRSYLYMADLMVWLWRILFAGRSGQAYNVGSDQQISISELASLISAVADIDKSPPPDGAGTENRYIPDITRARKDLNLECWTPLPEAIQKTMNWLTAPSFSDKTI